MAASFSSMLNRFAGQVAFNAGALAIQVVAGLAAIPIGTWVLGPADYGAYALALSFVLPLSALAEGGANMLLSQTWGQASRGRRFVLLNSMLAYAACVVIGLGLPVAAVLVAWAPLINADIERGDLVLAFLSVPIAVTASILRTVVIVDGRSWVSSLASTAQSVSTVLLLALLLFAADWHKSALFGSFLGGNIAGLIVLALGANRDGRAPVDASVMLAGLRNLPSAATTAMLEHGRGALEGLIVTQWFGLGPLGLLSHARLYHGMLLQGTNVAATALWPIALSEARQPVPAFVNVARAWNVVYLALACAGIGFGFLGRDVIALLTHGRFTEAAPLVPALVIGLFVQISGRPALATIYAHGQARRALHARSVSLSLSLIVLIAAPLVMGWPGVIAAYLFEAVLFRVLLLIVARSIRPVPFVDSFVILGIVVTGLAGILGATTDLSLATRLGLAMGMMACTVAVGANVIMDAFAHLRATLLPRPERDA